jgi:hypothetical protein
MTPSRPDVTIAPFNGKWPRIHDSAWIAPGCRIIGDVTIGADSSVWYNCVIRGDANRIVIGERTNIQDGSVIHCESPSPKRPEGIPTLIGDDVLIGHMAMVHGTVLEDRSFVGSGAITMDGCYLEAEAKLAAGAMLTSGKRIPSRQLWSGRPAQLMRELKDAQVADMQAGVQAYVLNARYHAAAVAESERGPRED